MKNFKVGIVSINLYTTVLNLACPLHSYAFQQFLEQHGIQSEIIDYRPAFYPEDYDGRHPLDYVRKHPLDDPERQRRLLRKWKRLYEPREMRYDKIQRFIDSHLRISEESYSAVEFERRDPGYDCYVCATDVLWKYEKKTGFDPGFFLQGKYLNGKGRIAYAVSRGASQYSEEQQAIVHHYLNSFDYLSVRELSFQNYLRELLDRPIALVLDPVFLHEKDFYLELAERPKRKGYVLIYLVMQKAPDLVETAVRFAEAKGLEVIELSDKPGDARIPYGTEHTVRYDIGVEEWLGYMADAEYIFTNSFHATCFSIIFQKQFWVGRRGGDKIDSLLELFDLKERRVLTDFAPADTLERVINYDRVKPLQREWVLRSEEYLLSALRQEEKKVCRAGFGRLLEWCKIKRESRNK